MLANQDLRNALFFGVGDIHLMAIEEHDDIGILFDRTGVAQIREHGPSVVTCLTGSGELRQDDHGNIKFLRQEFELARSVCNALLLSVGVMELDESQIVDDQHVEPASRLELPSLGGDLLNGDDGGIIDPKGKGSEFMCCGGKEGPA